MILAITILLLILTVIYLYVFMVNMGEYILKHGGWDAVAKILNNTARECMPIFRKTTFVFLIILAINYTLNVAMSKVM